VQMKKAVTAYFRLLYFEFSLCLLDFMIILYPNSLFSIFLGDLELSHENQKDELRHRLALLEKQIFSLTGNERVKARIEYAELLKTYRKECGLEESIYLIRA
jgi:hypothetical protein